MIMRPSGYRFLQGPFAEPPTVALAKVLSAWGARLTWADQREHAAQMIRAVEAHKTAATFIASSSPTVHGHAGPGPRHAGIWMEINPEFVGIRNRGIAIDGGEDERGPVD